MTCRQIRERLHCAGIENADGEALLLASFVTGRSTAELRMAYDEPICDPTGRLESLIDLRARRYPLQYLMGTWGFWRQEYEVSPDCLIPRADTEVLLEYAATHLPQGARVLDLCTGSGCIAISLLCERQDVSAVAVELYENTLAIAKRNAVRNGVGDDRLGFLQGDVLTGDFLSSLGRFDAILSNPPYIPTAQLSRLAPELAFEPSAALDGGEDGLLFYRRMLKDDYRAALKMSGFYLFEIGYDQGEALCALAHERGDECRIVRDLGGQDRVAVVTPAARAEYV